MNLTKISHGISWVLHPFLLPLYLLLLILGFTAFAAYPTGMKFYITWVVILYTMIIPVLSLGVLKSMGHLTDYRIDIRRERILPLLIGALCYVLCAVTIAKIPSAIFLRKFMLAAASCEILCLVVSLKWKISLHLTAMGALVSLLSLMTFIGVRTMFLPLVISVLAAGLLASARLYLGCHNGLQIFVGFTSGLIVSALAVLFF